MAMGDTKLLVSVVSASEVPAAVAGGADIIDVKRPDEGALGASFPRVIRRVRELTPRELPVSAAIGDVPNLPGTVALAGLGAAVCGVQYVKVGLLGPRDPNDAVRLLQEVCRAVRGCDPHIRIIATAYADAQKIDALPPMHLPAVAVEAGVDGCMLDTAVKSKGTLLTNLSAAQLQDFVERCRASRLLCALAGSLGKADIPRACEFGADIIGVRSAVCHGDRSSGRVARQKVQSLKALIAAHVSPLSDPPSAVAPTALDISR
jgi:uncharacterized protein (UPF0264 family)